MSNWSSIHKDVSVCSLLQASGLLIGDIKGYQR